MDCTAQLTEKYKTSQEHGGEYRELPQLSRRAFDIPDTRGSQAESPKLLATTLDALGERMIPFKVFEGSVPILSKVQYSPVLYRGQSNEDTTDLEFIASINPTTVRRALCFWRVATRVVGHSSGG